MSTNRQTTVWCDEPGCPEWYQASGRPTVARADAKANGWSLASGRDLCPERPDPGATPTEIADAIHVAADKLAAIGLSTHDEAVTAIKNTLLQVTLFGKPIGGPVYADEIADQLSECVGLRSRKSKRRRAKKRRRERLRQSRRAAFMARHGLGPEDLVNDLEWPR